MSWLPVCVFIYTRTEAKDLWWKETAQMRESEAGLLWGTRGRVVRAGEGLGGVFWVRMKRSRKRRRRRHWVSGFTPRRDPRLAGRLKATRQQRRAAPHRQWKLKLLGRSEVGSCPFLTAVHARACVCAAPPEGAAESTRCHTASSVSKHFVRRAGFAAWLSVDLLIFLFCN